MPGIAVRHRAHRVEDVGHRPHAAVEGDIRLLGRGVAVPERDDDASPQEVVDELERTRKLRRERDEPNRPGGEQEVEQLGIGIPTPVAGMRAEPVR